MFARVKSIFCGVIFFNKLLCCVSNEVNFRVLLAGILADFILQATLFTAFLAIDARRYSSY